MCLCHQVYFEAIWECVCDILRYFGSPDGILRSAKGNFESPGVIRSYLYTFSGHLRVFGGHWGFALDHQGVHCI